MDWCKKHNHRRKSKSDGKKAGIHTMHTDLEKKAIKDNGLLYWEYIALTRCHGVSLKFENHHLTRAAKKLCKRNLMDCDLDKMVAKINESGLSLIKK